MSYESSKKRQECIRRAEWCMGSSERFAESNSEAANTFALLAIANLLLAQLCDRPTSDEV